MTKAISIQTGITIMEKWLEPAIDYIGQWLEIQMRISEQPGCVVAIGYKDHIVLEQAFGSADLSKGEPLTPRHRFRMGSHSKSFTAAGVMKLRELGKMKLDDTIGRYVPNLNPRIARTTLGQILSHSAGIVRDGKDAGQFSDRRPFLNRSELLEDLEAPPTIEPNTRFKYSNHGFGLVGLAIELVTGEQFTSWIKREIMDAAGLEETHPDMPIPEGVPIATGHTGKLLLRRRVPIPGTYVTNAIAPAGGVVSTARDLALFFGQLSPKARRSILSIASRREMVRRQWRNQPSSLERYYGLGTISGTLNDWDWFGHSGSIQGYITRTCVIPQHDLTVSVLTNAIDGWAVPWVDGAMQILCAFSKRGAPSRKVRGWAGRWWDLWRAVDLVPMGDKVLALTPSLNNPVLDAPEIEITGRDQGHFAVADGYSTYGEPVRRVRNRSGKVVEVWLAASKLLPERQVANEIERRYSGCTGTEAARPRRANPAAVGRRQS
jgi:CubicO group peptidase (beta-lactamase class C family)